MEDVADQQRLVWLGWLGVYVVSDPVWGQPAAAELFKLPFSDSKHSVASDRFSEAALFSSSLEHTHSELMPHHTHTHKHVVYRQWLCKWKDWEHSETRAVMHANPTKLTNNQQTNKKKGWSVDTGEYHEVGNTSTNRPNGENEHLACLAAYFFFYTRPPQSEREGDTDETRTGSPSQKSDDETDEDEQAAKITLKTSIQGSFNHMSESIRPSTNIWWAIIKTWLPTDYW